MAERANGGDRFPVSVVVDSCLIGAVVVLLVALYFLVPSSVRAALSCDHGALNPIALGTSAFVHWSPGHLYGNLAGFLAAAGIARYLCALADERRWFRVTFLGLVGVLPFLVSISVFFVTVTFPGAPILSRGFSGVVAGFVAFAFVALVVLLAKTYSGRTVRSIGLAIVLVLLLEAAWLSTAAVPVAGMGLVLLGIVLCVWDVARVGRWPDSRETWLDRIVSVVFTGSIVLALALLVLSLVSSGSSSDCPTMDAFAHAIGFVYGGFLAGAIYRIQSSPWTPR